jgi:hypothetical protein
MNNCPVIEAEYKLIPALILGLALILVLALIRVLACELVEAQKLAQAYMPPLAYMLPPTLILIPAWILVLPMILMLVRELALACMPIEKSLSILTDQALGCNYSIGIDNQQVPIFLAALQSLDLCNVQQNYSRAPCSI